jgi:hypothetical protein
MLIDNIDNLVNTINKIHLNLKVMTTIIASILIIWIMLAGYSVYLIQQDAPSGACNISDDV